MGVPNGVMTVVVDEGLVDGDLVDLVDGGPVVVDPVDLEQNQLIKRN